MNKKKIVGIVLGLFLLGGCCNSISNSNDNKNDVKQEQQDEKDTSSASKKEKTEDTNNTNKTENKKQENTIPTEYKNALKNSIYHMNK